MKILKIAGIIILALVILFFITALCVSKDYQIEREVVINKPKAEVFDYIKHLKNQDNYNVWVKMDPGQKTEFKGTDGEVGFIYAWDGEKAGKGEQEIKRINEGESIDLELRFKKPFESRANAYFKTESSDPSETKVTWGMKGTSPYPMNIMNLMMDKMLGTDLAAGLNNLKATLEK